MSIEKKIEKLLNKKTHKRGLSTMDWGFFGLDPVTMYEIEIWLNEQVAIHGKQILKFEDPIWLYVEVEGNGENIIEFIDSFK